MIKSLNKVSPEGRYLNVIKVICSKSLQSCLILCNPVTVTHQTPLSMGFSKQEYWSGLPCPPPEDLPNPGIEPTSLMSLALAGAFFTIEPPGKPNV